MPEPGTSSNNTLLYFQTRDELVKVDLSKVIFFESDGNYTNVNFANGCKATVLMSLTDLEELIDSKITTQRKPFIRVGRKFIINSSYIFHINILRQRLVLTNCLDSTIYTLTVSKEALRNIKNLYSNQSQWRQS